MIKAIHIFDFDGTLVDSSHRYRTDSSGKKIDLAYWVANEHLAHLDKPIKPVCDVFKELKKSSFDYPLIATARLLCDGFWKVCKQANIIPPSVVARRSRDDFRGGAELKIAHVDRLLNLKQFKAVSEIHVHEDNLAYLEKIALHYSEKGYNVVKNYYPSNQGH
jgi:hypothetical protein